ncbi:excisionase family DNA binding protein [Microbacterium sp. BE35]|uniref:helix-turn-helix domain-containing protein n=1 Tax=Microbacterium sp. BE35 TaxID=2817773 RepID=UPI002860AC94|nr:excisionase family DNA binding protein [Microbacterium sp. BE35]
MARNTGSVSHAGPNDGPAQWLKVDDVARRLNCSRTFVLTEIRAGRLLAFRVGRHFRFDPSEVEAYCASLRQTR